VSRTTDGGATWTPYDLTGSYVGYPDEIVIPGPSTSYVVTSGGAGNNLVFRSSDTGETWEERTQGLPADVDLDSIFFLDTEIGYVGGGSFDDEAAIWKTTNGGTEWIAVPEVGLGQAAVQAMHWTDESTGVAGGYAGVYRTTDGGETWAETLAERCLLLAFRDNLTGIAGSYFDPGVWLTEDGGATWTWLAYPWAHAPDSLAAGAEGFLVGGMGSVILGMRPAGASDLVFADGFESGDTSAWSSGLRKSSSGMAGLVPAP